LIVYSDLQCPFCAELVPVLSDLQDVHGEDLRIVFRHFPLLPNHDKASLAGQAVEAAHLQDGFWEMHDYLFEYQNEWTELDTDSFEQWVIDASEEIGLDPTGFAEVMQSRQFESQMIESYEQGIRSGLHGTPTIFLNGEPFRLSPEIENLEPAIRLELLAARQLEAPELTIDTTKEYWADLELPAGTVTIRLETDSAPESVNSFVYLAEHGWFDNNPFYRVIEGVLVESGDPSGTGFGNPGYSTRDEVSTTVFFDRPGRVALSSAGPGTNGSRFFITLAPIPSLDDGTRTIIGDVTDGLELLERLPAFQPLDDLQAPTEAIIKKVTIRSE
jgi:cyclophilin family peptidyl-prolyl cis-trans isomerase/predicted DsbA family dithiol-disulfide isomerase